MLRVSQGVRPQAMSEEFPRDHLCPRDRVVAMETIGMDACGTVNHLLVGGRLEACAKVLVRTRARACTCSSLLASTCITSMSAALQTDCSSSCYVSVVCICLSAVAPSAPAVNC